MNTVPGRSRRAATRWRVRAALRESGICFAGLYVSSPNCKSPATQAVAGTPLSFDFDRATKRFEFTYDTKRASGKRRFRRGLTDVYIPRLHYRRGYRVRVTGATEVGHRGDQHLILRAKRGARRVSLVVTPRS